MKPKYVPQSNVIASDDPQIFVQQQFEVLQQLNGLRQAGTPPVTLQEYYSQRVVSEQ